MTTEKLLTEWLEVYQKEHIKARTYSRYQGLITMHIVPILGERNISELGRREIQEFLTQQKKDGNMRNGEKLSATSTNMMLSMLKKTHVCEYVEQKPKQRKLKRLPWKSSEQSNAKLSDLRTGGYMVFSSAFIQDSELASCWGLRGMTLTLTAV